MQAQAAGADVVLDKQPAHSMSFASANAFFDMFAQSGPMHARLLAMGAEHMASAKRTFLAAVQDTQPWVITPNARLLVLQKPSMEHSSML